MKIEELIDELNTMATELRKTMEVAVKRLEYSPPGFLKIRNERGSKRFYCIADRRYSKSEYLGNDKKHLKTQLAEKKYDAQLLRVVEPQLEAVLECLEILEGLVDKRDSGRVLQDMTSELGNLVQFSYADDNERYARQWQSIDFGRWPNDSQVFTTLRGDRVRSKSEVLIADRLFSKRIPYHYETVFELYDGTHVNPDFRILNKRTRKEFIWEHLGMMDNSRYCAHVVEKMDKYAKSGVILGRNLILTLESSQRAISTPLIDAMIGEYLV